jgi:hypothetical protein
MTPTEFSKLSVLKHSSIFSSFNMHYFYRCVAYSMLMQLVATETHQGMWNCGCRWRLQLLNRMTLCPLQVISVSTSMTYFSDQTFISARGTINV